MEVITLCFLYIPEDFDVYEEIQSLRDSPQPEIILFANHLLSMWTRLIASLLVVPGKSGSEAFLFAVAVEEVDEDDDDYLNGSDGEEACFLAVSEELGAEDGHHRDEIDCEQGWQPDRFADSLHCVMALLRRLWGRARWVRTEG